MRQAAFGGWICNGGASADDGQGCEAHAAVNGTRSPGPWWSETREQREARTAPGPLARLGARADELELVDPEREPLLTASDARAFLAARAVDDAPAWRRAQAEWLAMSPAQREERIALAQTRGMEQVEREPQSLAAIRRRVTALTLAVGLPSEVWAELCRIDSDLGGLLRSADMPIARALLLQDPAATAVLESKLAAARSAPGCGMAGPLQDPAVPAQPIERPWRDRADVERIFELEAEVVRLAERNLRLDKLSRCALIGCGNGGRCDGVGTRDYPCPLALASAAAPRIAALETALAALISRVRATGGYASPEEQDALWRAEQLLPHRGGP